MVNFFPTIYEGELLYSTISRYKRMAGIVNKRAFYRDLYGQTVSLNNVYFSVRIDELVKNIGVYSSITSDKIIEKNTVFKIFTAFLNEEKSNKLRSGMKSSASFNPYGEIGLSGHKIKFPNNLIYCEKCFDEDLKRYGEVYLRVIHQIPGVLYCNKHKIPLIKSNILSSESRINYICLDEIERNNEKVVNYDKFKALNLKYIEMIEWIYKNNVPKKEKEFFNNVYIDKLREKGFTSSNGSIRVKELTEAIKEFYGEEYLKIMQSEITRENNWISKFIREGKKNKHVLRHLLMIQFLDLSIEKIFNTKETVGKKEYIYIPNPRLDRDIQRERWLQVLNDNPNLSKSEYKRIGKGLYSWLYKNDNEWFEKITPKKKTLK